MDKSFEEITDNVLDRYFTSYEKSLLEEFFNTCPKKDIGSVFVFIFKFYDILENEIEREEERLNILLSFLAKKNRMFFYENIFRKFLFDKKNRNITNEDIEDMIVLDLYKKQNFDIRNKIVEIKKERGIDIAYNLLLWFNDRIVEEDSLVITQKKGEINCFLYSIPKAIEVSNVINIVLEKIKDVKSEQLFSLVAKRTNNIEYIKNQINGLSKEAQSF